MSKLIYVGDREGGENRVWKIDNGRLYPLPCRGCKEAFLPSYYDWGNDSPASFALSLSLLADQLLDTDLAILLQLDFWSESIRHLRDASWVIGEEALRVEILRLYSLATGSESVPMWRLRAYSPHPARSVRIKDGIIRDA